MSYRPKNNSPIGVLDSGVGGLSVWRELVKLMPSESVKYFADSGNCPYGLRKKEEVEMLCEKITRFFIAEGCKIIVVACNTATSMAIEYLRKNFSIPFVGIEPAVKPAALHSQTGVIGVLATAGTLNGRLFNETKSRFAGNVKVLMAEGNGLVEIVEQGKIGTPESEAILRKYIDPMTAENIDYLVLGCTHYPFLANDIRKITGDKVMLLDPAPAVALRALNILKESELCCTPQNLTRYDFYSSGELEVLKKMVAENKFKSSINLEFNRLAL